MEELHLLQVISVANWFDNFEVNYDPVDKKTIIRGWARYCTNNFFWTSEDPIKRVLSRTGEILYGRRQRAIQII